MVEKKNRIVKVDDLFFFFCSELLAKVNLHSSAEQNPRSATAKLMSNLGFKGLQVTFEVLTNLSIPTHN